MAKIEDFKIKTFKIKTLNEARELAELISHECPNSSMVKIGLIEIFINSIEHGNLGIKAHEKELLQKNHTWLEEIERRLNLPENINKNITVTYEASEEQILIKVVDEGPGFNWQENEKKSSSNTINLNKHGRGMLIAKKLAFCKIEYHGCGNEVHCIINK